MKKTYIKPEMEMEAIELESMIALSFDDSNTAYGDDDDFDFRMEGKNRNDNWGGLLW